MASSCPRDEALAEIGERLSVMREQEATRYAVPDYLAEAWQQRLWDATMDATPADDDDDRGRGSPSLGSAPSDPSDPRDVPGSSPGGSSSSSQITEHVTEAWRQEVCEWCYQVVDRLDFDREVVAVAISYLDRYLSAHAANRYVFQLAAMTALLLAIKLFEPGKLRMSSLVDLGRGRFLVEHVVAMEESMLRNLRWHVHPPTPLAFCRELRGLLGRDFSPSAYQGVEELSRFLTELSVCDYWFATKRPSSVALAAIINAVDLRGWDPRHKVEFLRRVADAGVDIANDDTEIVECYERLRELYLAGGYQATADPEGGEEVRQTRSNRESPVGVVDGPDTPGEEEALECA